MDLTQSIVPKSDQLNSDDLISGPVTVTITEVRAGNAEQPVEVHLAEFHGRPYKPSKSMRRVMVQAWGAESSTYTGHRLTLFRNPEIKFGGATVGGIEISHMSDLPKRLTVSLMVTRGKRKPFTVEPLPAAAPTRDFLDEAEQANGDRALLRALWKAASDAAEPQAHLDTIAAMAKPESETRQETTNNEGQ
jgi:hypothetical protein